MSRRRHSLLLVLVCAALLAACVTLPPALGDPRTMKFDPVTFTVPEVERVVLENGIIVYLLPDPEAVYKGSYPLTRFFNLYVRSKGRRLANGFITFVTSRDGQALVHDSGLVPTSVPVRFVRRSPMLSTHR